MTSAADDTAIRELIENWAAAVRVGDVKGVLAGHTGDILMFDVPEPLYSRGTDAYRKTWDLFFHYSRGGADAFVVTELEISAGGDFGFATAILMIMGSKLRLTIGLRREGGTWLIAHEHHSYAQKMEG